MKHTYNDGGRKESGITYKGKKDCVVRAISIATGIPYGIVFNELEERSNNFSKKPRSCKVTRAMGKGKGVSPSKGVFKKIYDAYLKELGWTWIPCMQIGSGCKVHMKADELPRGTIICRLSRHLCTVINGDIHDTHDCSREETRCVYGYYENKQEGKK